MGATYVLDIETDGFLDKGSRVHCIVAIDVATQRRYRFDPNDLRSGLDLIEAAGALIAHNGICFDHPFLLKMWPDLKIPKIIDTLIMSRLIYPDMRDSDFRMLEKNKDYALPKHLYGRHSLESWGYRLGDNKGDFGKDTDWSTYSEEMLDYCEQDTALTLKLYEHLKAQGPSADALEIEHEFAKIIFRQEQRGWAFDEEKASVLYAELVAKRQVIKDSMADMFEGWWEEMKTPEFYKAGEHQGATRAVVKTLVRCNTQPRSLERKQLLSAIAPGPVKRRHTAFNPGSRQHITRVFIEKYNWKPKEFTPGGEPKVDETVLKSLKYPEAQVLSEYFLLDKRIGQIAEGNQAWLRLVRSGRIHGRVNTLGAVTGRCTHSNPNVAQTPANGAPYGQQCRDLFVASKGMVLVGADASGLELRCLAHYMAHWDEGAYAEIVTTGDVHTTNQEAAGLPTRDNAKTFIYAFLYGAGDSKIGTIVGSGRKTGKFLKEKFLKTLPALGNLVKTVKVAASKGYIMGLDGRKLKIRSEHAALNTLLQSAGAIVMKHSLIESDRLLQAEGYEPGTDYEFVGNIHDEMQLECKPEIADRVGELLVQGLESATERFDFQCPLTGKYKKGASWKETH